MESSIEDSKCKWTGEAECYHTACGKEYEGEADGFAYCPMCGRRVEVMESEDEAEDDKASSIPQPSIASKVESEED